MLWHIYLHICIRILAVDHRSVVEDQDHDLHRSILNDRVRLRPRTPTVLIMALKQRPQQPLLQQQQLALAQQAQLRRRRQQQLL